MSVYGGDGWGRETQYRKRRVDDLLIQGLSNNGFSYKKFSSGKYACLICPHNPLLDSPLMLSMHCKGSRHLAAESRLKERELMRKDEINKRLALSDSPVGSIKCSSSFKKKVNSSSKPKAASEVLCNETTQQNCDVKSSTGQVASVTTVPCPLIKASDGSLVQQQFDYREVESEKSSLLNLVGSVTAMENGSRMKMLSSSLMKKIRMYA